MQYTKVNYKRLQYFLCYYFVRFKIEMSINRLKTVLNREVMT